MSLEILPSKTVDAYFPRFDYAVCIRVLNTGRVQYLEGGIADPIDIASAFFDLSTDEAFDIFNGRYFNHGVPLLMREVTPRHVADRINEYLLR